MTDGLELARSSASDIGCGFYRSAARRHLSARFAGAHPMKFPSLQPSGKITATGVYDLSLSEYLAQSADALSIGSSDAQRVIDETPKHLRSKWLEPRDYSKEAELGSLIHALVLEPHRAQSLVVVIKANDYKTDAARRARDAARAADKIPMLEKDLERAYGAVRAVEEDEIASELLSEGEAERSWYAKDPDTGLYLKCRPDFFTKGRIIIDVKAVGSTSPDFISRRIDDGQWYMQAPWYCDVVERVQRLPAAGYCWICVEHKPPHDVIVRKPTYSSLMHGHRLNQRAIKIIAHCQQTGEWPGNGGSIEEADLPTHAHYRLEEEAMRDEARGMEAEKLARKERAHVFS